MPGFQLVSLNAHYCGYSKARSSIIEQIHNSKVQDSCQQMQTERNCGGIFIILTQQSTKIRSPPPKQDLIFLRLLKEIQRETGTGICIRLNVVLTVVLPHEGSNQG